MKEKCSVRYCSVCGSRLIQKHKREEADYLVRTRHCAKCKTNIHTIEVMRDEFNASVEVLNKIIELVNGL